MFCAVMLASRDHFESAQDHQMISQIQDFEIRKAAPGDEEELARVHLQTWQEAYRGLISQTYLDGLSNELEERTRMWQNALSNPKRWAWVATVSNRIVGFILFGPPRDQNREGFVELGAIYLLQEMKGKGIGFKLLSTGFEAMKTKGFEKGYCWVLEKNPTISFYERTGAKFSNQTKTDEIGGQIFQELAYEWDVLTINT